MNYYFYPEACNTPPPPAPFLSALFSAFSHGVISARRGGVEGGQSALGEEGGEGE